MRIRMVPARLPWNSGSEIRFDMGDGPAQLTQGFGAMWETVPRPQRKAITRFVGADPIGQDIPILIDGFATRERIQSRLDALLVQQQPKAGGGELYPPTIWRIGGPIHFPQKRWVVADIEFGDALRSGGGELRRQLAILKLLEYILEDGAKVRRRPRRIAPRGLKGKQRVVSAKGRSLRQIAVKHYGTARAARPLGKAQRPPVRDVTRKLAQNRKIKLVRVTIP